MCFPHSVSPRTNARCQVHSRRLIHVCWTKPHTQSQGRACPRKRGGETARKGHGPPMRRTRARGDVCPREARGSTPERTRAAGMTRPQLTHSGVCSLPRVPALCTERQADSRGRIPTAWLRRAANVLFQNVENEATTLHACGSASLQINAIVPAPIAISDPGRDMGFVKRENRT